ncbi:MAG: DUF4276 family protein [Candidatus Zixiibacteriota bacterium]
MDKIRIIYFLEDRAHEGFIKALVERIAKEESIDEHSLIHDIRAARGGSRIINQFKNFIRDTSDVGAIDIDFLVVARDGNCRGNRERVKELERCIRENHPLKERVIYAIPDPHIERWYLIDQRALKEGVGLDKAPDLPPYKCKKDHYKQVLKKALKESNVNSLLGGPEYAERIVDNIDNLESLSQQNAGFQAFVENLRSRFRSIKSGQRIAGRPGFLRC